MAGENFDTEDKKEDTSVEETKEQEVAEESEADEEAAEEEVKEETTDDEPKEDEKSETSNKKKDKRDELIEDLNDRLKRQMAEFENFRKRSEKEKTQMFDMGAKNILEKILPIVDNFERGLASAPEKEGEDGFADGMRMVYKQLLTSLEEAGLTPIEACGKPFDPEYHNAVMHIDDEAYGENEIVEELQKGYMYRDTVVRHSMVKVAN